MENTLLFRVLEYAIQRDEFSLGEMFRHLKLTSEQESYIRQLVWDKEAESLATPNKIIVKVEWLGAHQADWKYRLLPDAIFSYVDHLEIVEARKNAKESRRLSWIAILFSLAIGLWQIIIAN